MRGVQPVRRASSFTSTRPPPRLDPDTSVHLQRRVHPTTTEGAHTEGAHHDHRHPRPRLDRSRRAAAALRRGRRRHGRAPVDPLPSRLHHHRRAHGEFGRLLDGLDGQGVPADPFEHATAEPLAALKDRPGSVGFVNAPLSDPAAAQARVERHLDDPRIRGIGEPTPPGGMRRDRTDPADRIRSRRPARPHGRVRSEHRAGPAHPCGALRPPPARPTHRGGLSEGCPPWR